MPPPVIDAPHPDLTSPYDKMRPDAARLHDLADRLEAEGSPEMAALVRRAADEPDGDS